MHCFTIGIFFFFLFSTPTSTISVSLSFNFTSFGSNENNHFIDTQGDAYISPQGIQLTPKVATVGRATYIEPLHLWDKNSGNLSDFSTHFSFVIDSNGRSNFGDGITFFFAPVNSSMRTSSDGSSIGLDTNDVFLKSYATFFAVEFDTYQNAFDPYAPHVGININSMVSVETAYWQNDIAEGRQNEAWISYTGSSKILTVNFTNTFNNTITLGSLSRVVDLRDYMPERVVFGFSGATGTLFEINTVKSWDFYSNLIIDVASNVPAPSPTSDPPVNLITGVGNRKMKRGVWGLALGLGAAGLLFVLLVLGFAGCFLKKKYNKEPIDTYTYTVDPSMEKDFEKSAGAKRFPYEELARATDGFAERLKLGEGGFGGVYKGFYKETDSYVAVKRISRGSRQGLKEYASEVKIISQLRHKNLVQLFGWCHERGKLLLVYEFLQNGSLDSHLFKHDSALTWEVRHKIAKGLASALLYLHEECEHCVVHRDIKSSNIMLDSNFNTKLGDFGLARLVDHEKGSQTTIVAGTRGYMAPEYMSSGRASKESDIFSFGVVLLEITCGKRANDARFQEDDRFIFVEWVWKLYDAGKILDSAEQDLRTEQNGVEMETLLVLGLWCAHPDCRHRPTIRQAMKVMNREAQLPVLPAVIPVYQTTHSNPLAPLLQTA